MKTFALENFIKGWIIGNFNPTLLNTKNFEIAIKKYKTGEREQKHYHKIGSEYTVIVNGLFKMNDKIYKENQIILVKPGEAIEFKCLADGVTVVIKTPSVKNDKYLVD